MRRPAALTAGEISREQAEVVVRTIEALPAEVTAAARADAETFLLEQAQEHDPGVLARLGRHLRHVLDPDAGESLARDEQAAIADRELFVSPDGFGGSVCAAGWTPSPARRC